MLWELAAFVAAWLSNSPQFALAQSTSATCRSGFEWASNDRGQSPCLSAAFLGQQCATSGSFNVPSITPSQVYVAPADAQANACQCNSVYYSLLSACAFCQGAKPVSFDQWLERCAENVTNRSGYPLSPPNGTHIPQWAQLPITRGYFDVAAAERSVTGRSSYDDDSRLPTPLIVGMSVGVTLFVVLVVAGLWYFFRIRRSRAGSLSSSNARYNRIKIEGPPRNPKRLFAKTKVVSYKPGLNFDLVQNRTGDLVELSDSGKGSRGHYSTPSSSSLPSMADLTNTSTRQSTSSPSGGQTLPTHHQLGSFSNLFGRPREVRHGDSRVDLDLGGSDASARPS